MLDKKPEKLIPRSKLNNLDYYDPEFGGFHLVKKYLNDILNNWIKTLENPLAIDWIQLMSQFKMEQVESRLSQYENQIGENNLIAVLEELANEGGNVPAILQKIESLQGEIIAFHMLKKLGHQNIVKINKIGDWQSNSSLVSVKSFLDLDIQYQIIEHLIKGPYYIAENSVLRNYDKIFIYDQKMLDYQFLTNVFAFIQNSYVNTINYLDEQDFSDYLHINFYKHMLNQIKGNNALFQVEVRKHQDQKEITIVFQLKEKRGSESEEHLIKIMVKKQLEEAKKNIYIHYDSNTYFEKNLDLSIIRRYFDLKVESFDTSFQKYTGEKEYIGWINISIHPQNETFAIDNIDLIKQNISSWYGNKLYKIIVCLHPQWSFDLKEPIIFEIP
ncbi:MAG: hypothetical protein ACOCWM_02495, partial [Cyclobacteriaceae bacterium]